MGNEPQRAGRLILPADDPKFLAKIKRTDPSKLSDAELVAACGIVAPTAGSIVEHATDVEWIIPHVAPAGSLILVGGEPKLAMKSLLLLHVAATVSDVGSDKEFLGCLPIKRRGRVVVINMEDGRDRLIRRAAHFGVQPDDPRQLHLVWRREGLPVVHEWMRRTRQPARAIVVDPLVELGVDIAGFDENAARDMASLLGTYRDIAQLTGAVVFLVHHFRKEGDRMRGSSALEGACDGWWNIHPQKHGGLRLQWVMRDGSIGEVDYEVRYSEARVTVAATSDVRHEHTSFGRGKKRASDGEETQAAIRSTIERVLRGSLNPLSRSELFRRVGKSRGTTGKVLDVMIQEGFVAQHAHSQSKLVSWAGA